MLTSLELVITVLAGLGPGLIGLAVAPRSTGSFARMLAAVLAGSGAAALALFLAGVAGLWTPQALRVVAILSAVAGVAFVRVCLSWRWQRPRLGATEWTAIVVFAAVMALVLLSASAPVTDWDGLSYHLEVPRIWMNAGRIDTIPFIHHSNFPLASEMLFAPAVAWKLPQAAKVLHWLYFLMAASGAGLLASIALGRQAGVWTAVALACVPVALWEALSAYIDLFTAAYMAASAACVAEATSAGAKERKPLVICAALLAGFASGTKTFALVWVALGALWLAVDLPKQERLKWPLLFAVVAALLCAPWYLRTYIATGNPVYPFLFSVFGGSYWGEAGVHMYRETWTSFGTGRTLPSLLSLPWSLMTRGGRFIDGNFFFGSAGMLFAALLPAAWPLWKGQLSRLASAVGLYVVIWFVLSQQSRYLIPVLVLALPLAASAAARWDVVGKAARGAVIVGLVVSGWLAFLLALPAYELATGAVTKDAYISRDVNSYWAAEWLPADARLLLYGETRGYYFSQPYVWADESLSTLIPYGSFKTPRQMLDWFKKEQYTHALINRRFAPEPEASGAMRLWKQAAEQGLVRRIDGGSEQSRGVEIWQIP